MGNKKSINVSVRSDLEDIENTIYYLHEMADYFQHNNHELWPKYWKGDDVNTGANLIHHSSGKKELGKVLFRIYRKGRDTSVSLSEELRLINDIKQYPQVSNFVSKLESFQEWVEKDKEDIELATELMKNAKNQIRGKWCAKKLIDLHSDQIERIKSLSNEIRSIKKSERYKIEMDNLDKDLDRDTKKVFIMHGHSEAKWRELEKIVKDLGYDPVVLQEKPDKGSPTVIEKFERYAQKCSYAIALFTPDDEVKDGNDSYLQARPNVMFEFGWFCGYLSRENCMLILKRGTSIFSDMDGVLQKRFDKNVSEIKHEIREELSQSID